MKENQTFRRNTTYPLLPNCESLNRMAPEQLIIMLNEMKNMAIIDKRETISKYVVEKLLSLLQGTMGIIKLNGLPDQTFYHKEKVLDTYRQFVKIEKELSHEKFWNFFQRFQQITFFDYEQQPHNLIQVIYIPLQYGKERIGCVNILGSPYQQLESEMITEISVFAEYSAIRIESILEHERTTQLAYQDSLTGLYNRRYFMTTGEQELKKAHRYQKPMVLMMIDIDHFKQINDRYGHPTGDFVLQELSQMMRNTLREADIIGRYGGEEFVALMPETALKQACKSAERLRHKIGNRILSYKDQLIHITISIGLTEVSSDDELATLIQRADQFLYMAKENGRDQVVSEETHLSPHSHTSLQ